MPVATDLDLNWPCDPAGIRTPFASLTLPRAGHLKVNFSDPAGIQTLDLQNRNLTLYSAKLRDLFA